LLLSTLPPSAMTEGGSPLGNSASAPVFSLSRTDFSDGGLGAARRADFSGGSWNKARGNDEVVPSLQLLPSGPRAAAAVHPPAGIADDDALVQLIKRRGRNPGPGDYAWRDDVHLRRRPVCVMASPDRNYLDLMVPSWFPASSSLQPRSPDPAEYSNLDYNSAVGRNGKLGAPKWSLDMTPGPCRETLPLQRPTVPTRHFAMVGGTHHPTRPMQPNWSIQVPPHRINLPVDTPTRVPRMTSELRPGPGQYNIRQTRKPTSRARCSFGGRPQNVVPMSHDWNPRTHGSNQASCEHLRMRLKPSFAKK